MSSSSLTALSPPSLPHARLHPYTLGVALVLLLAQLKGIQDKELCLSCLGGSTSTFVRAGAGV